MFRPLPTEVWLTPHGSVRPKPVNQNPLPSWDFSDPGGEVHTTQPPDLVIPPGYSIDFWRGDPWGVTLPVSQTPALVPGCNTTPPTMVMSYLLPWYGSKDRDNILTAHAQRNFSHFHLDMATWQQAGLSIPQAVSLFQYVQSWGFFTTFWGLDTQTLPANGWTDGQPILEPFLQALIAGTDPTKSIFVIGEEMNSYTGVGSTGITPLIQGCGSICNPVGLRMALHLTSNYRSWYDPNDGSEAQWGQQVAPYLWGQFWQADQTDFAGTMGAHLWDTRRFWGPISWGFHVPAFELEGENLLYARPYPRYSQPSPTITEDYSALCGTEMLFCTSDGSAPPVAGASAARNPNGNPI